MKKDELVQRLRLLVPPEMTSDLESLDCETASEAWDRCGNLDWMLRIAAYAAPRDVMITLVCDYAEHVLPIAESWLRENAPGMAQSPRNAVDATRRRGATPDVQRSALDAYNAIANSVANDVHNGRDVNAAACDAAFAAMAAFCVASSAANMRAAGVDDVAAAASAISCMARDADSDALAWQVQNTRNVIAWPMIADALREEAGHG